jgi:protease I
MNQDLQGKSVAILATDGFEQSELEKPREALLQAGADVDIVSLKSGSIKGWAEDDFGDSSEVDVTLDSAKADDYDALLLPGGVMNPDKLRVVPAAVKFVRSFFDAGKPVAAICHGPQTLIEANVVRGRRLTSFPSIKTDLVNAGAQWVDETVVVDRGLVTSRRPADIPKFTEKMIAEFAAGKSTSQRKAAAM